MANRFPADCRLKSARDIQAVFAYRDIFRGERLVFYRGPRAEEKEASDKPPTGPDEHEEPAVSRFCLVVSKKCGKAARRNRIKRILREIIRNNRMRIGPGYDYVIRVIPEVLTDRIRQEDFLADFSKYYGWE